MPTLDSQIRDIVKGDDISLRRTIGFTASGFDAGTTITDAWLTVKAAALELGKSEPTIRRYLKKCFLLYSQPEQGHGIRIHRSSVERLKRQMITPDHS